MLKKSILSLTGVIVISSLVLLGGCSDDKTPTGLITGTEHLEQFASLVQSVAPPIYESPDFFGTSHLSPMPADSFWLDGATPWIGKAFGDKWPMALYKNVADLDGYIGLINFAITKGAGTHSRITGFDTSSVTVTISDLVDVTTIPAAFQPIFGGTTASLDKYYHIVEDDVTLDVGLSFTKDDASILIYRDVPDNPDDEAGRETVMYYGYVNLATGTLVFSGINFKVLAGAVDYSSGYKLTSNDGSTFDYSMSYYVNNPGYNYTMVECLVGGGDKDSSFVLRHAKYFPADGPLSAEDEYVAEFAPPDYVLVAETAPEALADYVTDSNLYDVNDLPSTWFSNPWD